MEAFLEKYGINDTTQLYSYKIKQVGRTANKRKNPIVKQKDFYVMYCENDTEVILDDTAIEKISEFEKQINEELVFYNTKNGYIATHLKCKKCLYIHQIITGCYGNGKGTKNISVDHIDQNPLNNRYTNLRVADRYTQEQNTKGIKEGTKCARKTSAKELPDGITQEMMMKYVVYYKEVYNKQKNLTREFFKIEKHPKLQKIWIGSKSNKISIKDKLEIANKVVIDLSNDIYPDNYIKN
jgi:hypothetical protein